MKLYALKCRDGYLKICSDIYCCVELDKASVFPKENLSSFPEYIAAAGKMGFVDIRVAELVVTENEDFVFSI